ncbi:MerR family transcriptional regulator [Pandoraea cepalis]|uniref:MerR family transcriptional regulator n=1 Tax=Pandoraea cepalis TaxID=2508294 RepID=UPI0012419C6B|nr:MerR family transcriptional regulator [Pandoraea cepalis]
MPSRTIPPNKLLLTTTSYIMHYTPQQVQKAVGIGQETLRYWKRALPPLADHHGQSASFSFSDLVALKVVYLLVARSGMGVSFVSSFAEELFEVCRAIAPHAISGHTALVIQLENNSVKRVATGSSQGGNSLHVVVPLARCVDELVQSLRENDEPDSQISLPLPLTAVFTKA